MSWSIIEDIVVKKTRKDHSCEHCGRTIPKGSPNIRHWKGNMDGELQSSYACHWCDEHGEIFVENFSWELLDFGSCVESFFEDVLQGDYRYYKSEGDYFVFRDYHEEAEDVRICCPIIEKEVK
jgi:hypothetical protein